MNKPMSLCAAILCAVPLSLMAEGPGLEDQITGIKAEIAAAQQINIELKTQLAAKETEAAELKVKLKQIEEQIDAVKKEHQLESK